MNWSGDHHVPGPRSGRSAPPRTARASAVPRASAAPRDCAVTASGAAAAGAPDRAGARNATGRPPVRHRDGEVARRPNGVSTVISVAPVEEGVEPRPADDPDVCWCAARLGHAITLASRGLTALRRGAPPQGARDARHPRGFPGGKRQGRAVRTRSGCPPAGAARRRKTKKTLDEEAPDEDEESRRGRHPRSLCPRRKRTKRRRASPAPSPAVVSSTRTSLSSPPRLPAAAGRGAARRSGRSRSP